MTGRARAGGDRCIAYLCLQATREGQASHAHVHEIIKGLRKRGWAVDLFEPRYARGSSEPKAWIRLYEMLRVQLQLMARAAGRPLYIRWHFASWLAAAWAALRRVPVVQEVNGPYEDLFLAWPWTRRLSRLFVALMRSQLRWARAVVAVTPQLADWVKAEAGAAQRVFVVPNGANVERFRPGARFERGLDVPRPYVVFVGALARWQGVDVMLEAVERPEWPAEVSLVIAGDGVERAKVQAAAGTSRRVRYLGPVPYAAVPGLVAHSIGALSPQVGHRGDTGLFPLKVFEAMACGVPVIVSDYPGMRELVADGACGLVVPAGDASALARAVAYLHAHEVERARMGQRGRELVEREHSWDRRAEQTAAILEQVTSANGWECDEAAV